MTGRVARLKEDYEIGIRWIAFPLHPETPEEGTDLDELFERRERDRPSSIGRLRQVAAKLGLPWLTRTRTNNSRRAYERRLQQVAAELGLPWVTRTRTYNSRKAHELGKWAEAAGRGDEFHLAVFQANFAARRNIADISVLKEIVETIGLDGQMVEQALSERTFKEAVDRDWEYSHACGITGVPTFMLYGRKVVGAQPYQALEDLVTASGGNMRK